MPKRGHRVAPSTADEWDLRFGDNAAADGWEQLSRTAPGPRQPTPQDAVAEAGQGAAEAAGFAGFSLHLPGGKQSPNLALKRSAFCWDQPG